MRTAAKIRDRQHLRRTPSFSDGSELLVERKEIGLS